MRINSRTRHLGISCDETRSNWQWKSIIVKRLQDTSGLTRRSRRSSRGSSWSIWATMSSPRALWLLEGKAPKSVLQAKFGAFGPFQYSHARHDGYGRSVAINKRRVQIYFVNLSPFHKTHQNYPNENANRSRSSEEMYRIFSNVRNPRRSTGRSGFKLHKSSDRESVGTARCTHTSYNCIPTLNRPHHRTFQLNHKYNTHSIRSWPKARRLGYKNR